MSLSKLFSMLLRKDTKSSTMDSHETITELSLYDALCSDLQKLHFRTLPNGQKIDGYADADLYIHIQRNGHDLEAMIDHEDISVIVDEETDTPIERNMKLHAFSTTTEVFETLYRLTDELCGKAAN